MSKNTGFDHPDWQDLRRESRTRLLQQALNRRAPRAFVYTTTVVLAGWVQLLLWFPMTAAHFVVSCCILGGLLGALSEWPRHHEHVPSRTEQAVKDGARLIVVVSVYHAIRRSIHRHRRPTV